MTDVVAPAAIPTRALSQFVAAQASGTRVLLPLDARYKYNGPFYVPTGVVVTSQGFASGGGLARHAIFERPSSYQLRIVPDTRQGTATYNPRGRSSQWQYDVRGGVSHETGPDRSSSRFNPYGVVVNADGSYTPKSSGSQWGGYDATTEIISGHLHLVALFGAPWLGLRPTDVIQYLIVSGTGGTHQALVSQVTVAADGRSIDFGPAAGLPHVDTSGTVAWCIHAAGAGWALIDPTDPTVPPAYVGPTYAGEWDGYENALARLQVLNKTPVVYVKTGGQLIGVEVVGANAGRLPAITNFEKSDPLVNELTHGVYLEPGAQAILVESHHHGGDGFNGPGTEAWVVSHDNGRQGTVGSYDDKVIVGRYYGNRHSDIDIENPSGGPNFRVSITATLGGTGIAWSTPLVDSSIHVHSTQGDIAAGLIPTLSAVIHAHWGGGGSNVDVVVVADSPGSNGHDANPALKITGAGTGLRVHDSSKPTTGKCWLETDWTNVTTAGNTLPPSVTTEVCA